MGYACRPLGPRQVIILSPCDFSSITLLAFRAAPTFADRHGDAVAQEVEPIVRDAAAGVQPHGTEFSEIA